MVSSEFGGALLAVVAIGTSGASIPAAMSLPDGYQRCSTIIEQFHHALDDASAEPGQVSKEVLLKVLHQLDCSWTLQRLDVVLNHCGACAGLKIDYGKFVQWLFHATSFSEYPVKKGSEKQRARFLREQWEPFQQEVQALLERTKARSAKGFSLHEIMPSNAILRSLMETCAALTTAWHGRANFSYVYEMFMDMAECDGHSAYLFQDIPQQRSDDGFVRVLDAGARKRLYTGSKSKAANQSTVSQLPSELLPFSAFLGKGSPLNSTNPTKDALFSHGHPLGI